MSASRQQVLHVDWTRCDGHGACAELLPTLLALDPWGFPMARGDHVRGDPVVPPGERAQARRAIAACPLLALRLLEVPSRGPVQRAASDAASR
ncbi:ferredoxin [Nocardioides sp. GXZ039]|uniref:ferredoxin n=1 Tax=Nocardioides sp. GXZ039 TaxID=3136018 RepID=UPI0030F3E814